MSHLIAGDCFVKNNVAYLVIEVSETRYLVSPVVTEQPASPLVVVINEEDWIARPTVLGTESQNHSVSLDSANYVSKLECPTEQAGQLKPHATARVLKALILNLSKQFSELSHQTNLPAPLHGFSTALPTTRRDVFKAGATTIPYAGRVFDSNEVTAAISSTLDFWLTLGSEGAALEKELASYLGVHSCLLVNSGSSANLIAVATLTSHKLPAERRLMPGDEVITCAAGFPTTVAPIIQNGAIPVFIDNNPTTGNCIPEALEAAYRPERTKAVMMAHTLGNPFDIGAILRFCKKYDLWLIEDNCDALGCSYSMPLSMARELDVRHLINLAEKGTNPAIRIHTDAETGQELLTAPTGTWGDLSTQSFYPPHHLTMGEGGAVNIVSRGQLKSISESFRDWGRDCWCASGKDNTCNKRFGWQLGELPMGYDHKYIYSHLGYNLKPLDPQAAIGRVQLKKLPAFVEARKRNWQILRQGLNDLSHIFDFTLPTHATAWTHSAFNWDSSTCKTDCSWFGFMIRVRKEARFSHSELGQYLDAHKIGNRMLFGGNLLRQPAFVQLKRDRPDSFRVPGTTVGADEIMNSALFLGTYPGLTSEMLSYEIEVIHDFVAKKGNTK